RRATDPAPPGRGEGDHGPPPAVAGGAGGGQGRRGGVTMATTADRVRHATEMAEMWLYRANRAAERGEQDKAERHYERAQRWHDEMNRLLGNGDGTDR